MIKNVTILLVEDDSDDELLILRALQGNDIDDKVFVARDGEQALDFLFCKNIYAERDPDYGPRLILLDVNLPKIDGLEVLRRLRADQRTRLIPVVMLTSSREEQDLVESYKNGANSFIRKPVDYTEFVEFVRQLGFYWLELNPTPSR